MSEFSESYHLRSDNTDDAVQLLKKAKLKGFVFPAKNGWVTFLAEDGSFLPDSRIVSKAQQPLLHYAFAEDHGWSFEVFENSQLVCGVEASWDEVKVEGQEEAPDTADDGGEEPLSKHAIPVNNPPYVRDVVFGYVHDRFKPTFEKFELTLKPEYEHDPEAEPTAYRFATSVGLPYYEWLSYDDVKESGNKSDQCKELIVVKK